MAPSSLIWLLGLVALVSSAAVVVERQTPSSSSFVVPICPITLVSYIVSTTTVTDTPATVTIVIPDYSSIAASLARVSTIDSIVVVEQSQDAPISAPVNTIPPVFTHTIVAPAFEATEAPSNNSKSVYYVSASHNASQPGNAAPSNVVIGVTTLTILPHTANSTLAQPTTTVRQTVQLTSTVRAPFSNTTVNWNSSSTGTSVVDATLGTAASTGRLPTGHSTITTYIATQTVTASAYITVNPDSPAYIPGGYGSPDQALGISTDNFGVEKRQTCVLISAQFNGIWATWCNNWDGSTAMTYTSWETTVTPGVGPAAGTATQMVPNSPVTPGSSTISPPVSSLPPPSIPDTASAISSASQATSFPTGPESPMTCGELGVFDVNFDTLPRQSATNETAGLPPIFNPYNHFYWSSSWSYVPPPPDPYPPQSGALLGISTPQSQIIPAAGIKGLGLPDGGFGAGPRDHLSAYWFNARWAFVGCQPDIADPSGICDVIVQGYRYDNVSQLSQLYVTQHFTQPLCTSGNCQLQQIVFNQGFTNLTTLAFYARIGQQLRTLYVDSVRLDWVNNTCEAGRLRASSR